METSIRGKIYDALKEGSVIIYGAHLVAIELYRYLKSLHISFDFKGFAVTEMDNNPLELEKEKVAEIQSYPISKNTTIMIAMPEKYHNEVETYARRLGYISFINIGLVEMSELKCMLLLGACKNGEAFQYHLYRDAYDGSWMNIVDVARDIDKIYEPIERHYKFPTLFYLDIKTTFLKTRKFDFYRDYERVFGIYHNLHSFPFYGDFEKETGKVNEVLNLYMVFSQWDNAKMVEMEFPDWICPLQAGSALTEKKIGLYLDERGTNISTQNSVFAEMTAAYWIWKNAEPVKYKGLCHYRRHFVLTTEEVMALDANGIDVVLTTPRYVPGGLMKMFMAETPVKEQVFCNVFESIAECHPEDTDAFGQYIDECLYCPNNMVIARCEIYDTYCEWIFPVLFQMLETDRKKGYGHMEDRHIAYAAELLTSYFFAKHRNDYCIALTDYRFY